MITLPLPGNTSIHSVQLLQGSRAFFESLIQDMDSSTHEIQLETYIFDVTASGIEVAKALERAAKRGVQTKVMVDGVGSPPLPVDWQQRLKAASVRWKVYTPLGIWGLLRPGHWRRLHRKLVCIDQRVAYCGGINILDDFYDPNHGLLEHPRFDFSVRIMGPLVVEIHDTMNQLWERVQRERALKASAARSFKRTKATVIKVSRRARSVLKDALQPLSVDQHPIDADSNAQSLQVSLVLRDNLLNRAGIEHAYRLAISQAKTEVIIANAYFLPGRKLRLALIHAARRGVSVKLLLQGNYEYFMQYYAARPVYGELLNAGVEIHEYATSFLHAKVAVIDGVWSTVGSSNLDPLSMLLAREANIVFRGQAFAHALKVRLVQAIEREGRVMDPAQYANRPWHQRVLERVAWALMRLALLFQGKKYL